MCARLAIRLRVCDEVSSKEENSRIEVDCVEIGDIWELIRTMRDHSVSNFWANETKKVTLPDPDGLWLNITP